MEKYFYRKSKLSGRDGEKPFQAIAISCVNCEITSVLTNGIKSGYLPDGRAASAVETHRLENSSNSVKKIDHETVL